MKKRLLSILLTVLMIVSLLPVSALAANIVKSGTCGAEGDGSNLTWTLDSDGVLTISGSGDMHDYGPSVPPWHGIRIMIKSAVIADGVTSIGRSAFDDCRSLTSVTIPDSVTSIGEYAFSYCTSLTGIWVAEGNSHYSSDASGVLFNKDKTTLVQCPGAFSGSYAIPNSVTSIVGYAFEGCASLTSVTIPDGVTSIGGLAFCYCTSLTSVTIPDSVTSIGLATFYNCRSLTSVTIPDSVTIIGGSAFSDCDNLTDVYYTGTEIAWNKIKISDYNDALKNATIHYFSEWTREKEPTCTEPGSETSVCPEAGCGKTFTREIPALGHAWDNGKVTKEPTATETGIKIYTCTRCDETKTETIPATGSVDVTQMFTDVQKGWAYPGIQYCVTNGLMAGKGDGKFDPSGMTTRAEFVQMLYSLHGKPEVSGALPFTDLPEVWYRNAVLWAYQTGVTSGTSDTTFSPYATVTRAQVATFLMKYAKTVCKIKPTWTPADLSKYPDVNNVPSWALGAMQDAVALGLINGNKADDGTIYLDPNGNAPREQVATILMQFCKNVKK